MMLGAATPVGSAENVLCLKRRHALRRRDVNLSCEEVREVARERRLHAVRPLIQEDSVTPPDHCAVAIERERESRARRKTKLARAEQAAIPSSFR